MPILPVVTYDDEVLRTPASRIEGDSGPLQQLIDDMFETMYNARGVGLAAPQIGRSIRLFVADIDVMAEETGEPKQGPKVFINPEIVSKGDDQVSMEEGCLSIPDVKDNVTRAETVTVRYLNGFFKEQEETAEGWFSRVIQHEMDHLDGILFIDHISSFRRRMQRRKLREIAKGNIETEYPLVPKKESV